MVVSVVDLLPLLSEDQALCAPRPTLSVDVAFLVVAAVEPRKLALVVAEAVSADRLARRIRLKRAALPAKRARGALRDEVARKRPLELANVRGDVFLARVFAVTRNLRANYGVRRRSGDVRHHDRVIRSRRDRIGRRNP